MGHSNLFNRNLQLEIGIFAWVIRWRSGGTQANWDDSLTDFDASPNGTRTSEKSDISSTVAKELINFDKALLDDLSMPRAAASLFGIIKAAETEFKRYKKAEKDTKENDTEVLPLDLSGLFDAREAIMNMDQVFGIFYTVPLAKNEDGTEIEDISNDNAPVPQEIMDLVQSRSNAKDQKDWELADSLRSRITELGYSVKDVKGGEPVISRLE